jgi:hypothetical protein
VIANQPLNGTRVTTLPGDKKAKAAKVHLAA